ncbi:MAG TPA: hypothetical protein VJ844_11815, partial [Mucilaginibacter sp.]|nr:hypothetical protein [Mucilaginibacter sp.]
RNERFIVKAGFWHYFRTLPCLLSRCMKKLTFSPIPFICCITAYGQQKKIDSLKKLIAAAKDDTSRALLMRDLNRLFFYSKPDSAMQTAHKMRPISKSGQYAKAEIMALNDQGIVYRNSANHPKALSYYLSAPKACSTAGR